MVVDKKVSRYDEKIIRTYVQDAHKPWSGHIQGTYYVGAPTANIEQPECALYPLELRTLPCAIPYEPDRPAGVKPYPPYRRPTGSESSPPPYVDTGIDFPPETYLIDPSLSQLPVGLNEIPSYYGVDAPETGLDFSRIEGEVSSDPIDYIPRSFSPDWSPDNDRFASPGFKFEHGPVAFEMDAPTNEMLGIPPMIPRPDVPFWGDAVEYGVTKVIDKIIQDNPGSPWPEKPEELGYMPQGLLQPWGLETISKNKDLWIKDQTMYGADKQAYGQPYTPNTPNTPNNANMPNKNNTNGLVASVKRIFGIGTKTVQAPKCKCYDKKPNCKWPTQMKCAAMYGASCMWHCTLGGW